KVDGVYVKAGSELSPRKTAAQQILPKGAEVTILGESEGFLKIAPPEGSYLYISEQYVHPVGPDGPKFTAKKASEEPESSVVSNSSAPKTTEQTRMTSSGNTMVSVEKSERSPA